MKIELSNTIQKYFKIEKPAIILSISNNLKDSTITEIWDILNEHEDIPQTALNDIIVIYTLFAWRNELGLPSVFNKEAWRDLHKISDYFKKVKHNEIAISQIAFTGKYTEPAKKGQDNLTVTNWIPLFIDSILAEMDQGIFEQFDNPDIRFKTGKEIYTKEVVAMIHNTFNYLKEEKILLKVHDRDEFIASLINLAGLTNKVPSESQIRNARKKKFD